MEFSWLYVNPPAPPFPSSKKLDMGASKTETLLPPTSPQDYKRPKKKFIANRKHASRKDNRCLPSPAQDFPRYDI